MASQGSEFAKGLNMYVCRYVDLLDNIIFHYRKVHETMKPIIKCEPSALLQIIGLACSLSVIERVHLF